MPEARASVIIEVKNQGAKEIADLGNQMKDAQKNMAPPQASIDQWKNLKTTLRDVGIVTGLVAGGVLAAKKAYDATIGATVTYAAQVRQLSRNLNVNSIEAARLIQVSDDYKISAQDLTTALEMAVKRGYVPTIENIALLADQFNNLKSPTERAALLSEKFGKNWAILTPLLEQGGAAIRQQSAAIEQGLLPTEKQLDQARQNEIVTNTLTNQWKAYSYQIGNKAIPTVNNLVGSQILLNKEFKQHGEWLRLVPGLAAVWQMTLLDDADAQNQVTQSTQESAAAMEGATRSTQTWNAALEKIAEMGDIQIGIQQTIKTTREGWKGLGDTVLDIAKNYIPEGGKLWNATLTEIDKHTGTTARAQSDLKKEVSQAFQQLGREGLGGVKSFGAQIDEIGKYLLGVDEPLAGFEKSVADAATNVNYYLGTIPDVTNKFFYMNTVYTYSGKPPGGGTPYTGPFQPGINSGCASGGPWSNTVSEVGEQGAEGIMPRPGGGFTIVPHARWEQMKRGGGFGGRKFASGANTLSYPPVSIRSGEAYTEWANRNQWNTNPHNPRNPTYDPSGDWANPQPGAPGAPAPPSVQETAAAVTSAIPGAVAPMMTQQALAAARSSAEVAGLLRETNALLRTRATDSGVGQAVSNALQQGNMMG